MTSDDLLIASFIRCASFQESRGTADGAAHCTADDLLIASILRCVSCREI